jgi:hypothetical protein
MRRTARGRLVLVEKDAAPPLTVSGAAPSVIRDEMDATRHMADNHYYTSKAKFRQATRAANCVEVGNELAALTRPRGHGTMPTREQRRAQIREAVRRQLHGAPY